MFVCGLRQFVDISGHNIFTNTTFVRPNTQISKSTHVVVPFPGGASCHTSTHPLLLNLVTGLTSDDVKCGKVSRTKKTCTTFCSSSSSSSPLYFFGRYYYYGRQFRKPAAWEQFFIFLLRWCRLPHISPHVSTVGTG